MSLWTKLESQLINLRAFRPFFPAGRTLADIFVLPAQMARRGGRANAFPFVVNLNVTTRCNLHCPYCFNADNRVPRTDELTLDDYRRLAAAWAGRRPGIFISGGEPFARGDLLEIVESFKAHHLPVGLVTNGTLATAAAVERLANLGLDSFLVSFHGGRATHDHAVGLPGAYDKSLEALRLWAEQEAKAPAMVNYVLSPESVADLPEFVAETADIRPLAVRLSHLNFLTGAEVAAQRDFWDARFPETPIQILSHQWEPEAGLFAPLIEFMHSPQGRGVITKPVLGDEEIRHWYSPDARLGRRCVFIWRSTFLNAQGDVYPCQFLYVRMGNVKSEPLAAIWNNQLYRKFRATLKEGLMPGCARCCKI